MRQGSKDLFTLESTPLAALGYLARFDGGWPPGSPVFGRETAPGRTSLLYDLYRYTFRDRCPLAEALICEAGLISL